MYFNFADYVFGFLTGAAFSFILTITITNKVTNSVWERSLVVDGHAKWVEDINGYPEIQMLPRAEDN